MQNKVTFPNFTQFSQAFNAALAKGVSFAVVDDEGNLTKVKTSTGASAVIKDLEISWLILTFKDGKKASINFTVDYDYETKQTDVAIADYSTNDQLVELFKLFLSETADF